MSVGRADYTGSVVIENIEAASAVFTVTGNINATIQNATISVTQSGSWTMTVTGAVTISGTANVTIVAQNVSVSTEPQWAAVQGTDITVIGSIDYAIVNYWYGPLIDYVVPTGYLDLIYDVSAHIVNNENATYVRPAGAISIALGVAATTVGYWSGECGFHAALSRPIRATAGHHVQVNVLSALNQDNFQLGVELLVSRRTT